jgi:hypothetical protein
VSGEKRIIVSEITQSKVRGKALVKEIGRMAHPKEAPAKPKKHGK